MPRLFVCVWIPENMKANIIKFQEKISRLPLKAKFVEKENLHLTITFLGEREDIEDIKSSLEGLKGFGTFKVSLSGLKIIPSENYIRVIGVNVKDDGSFSRLIKMTIKLIGGEYYETGKLTLCRVHSINEKQSVLNFLKENKDIDFGSFEVEKISLVKSTLTPKGPIYNTIYEVNL
ncbi:MAG: RNA 2',3'-cyclic phosphodiesterase [Candidatus Aenigmatarchaeota archaeon]